MQPGLEDSDAKARVDTEGIHVAVGELRPILVFEVNGAHVDSVRPAEVEPAARSKRQIAPVRVVVREVEVAEAEQALGIGLKAADVEVVSAADRIGFGVDIRGLILLQPAAFGLNAETTPGVEIDETRDTCHLPLAILERVCGAHDASRQPGSSLVARSDGLRARQRRPTKGSDQEAGLTASVTGGGRPLQSERARLADADR